MVKATLFIPLNFSIKILKNNFFFLYLHNSENYFIIPVKELVKVNRFTNTVRSYNSLTTFFTMLTDFFYYYSSLNLKLIKFKGKGYKLTKKDTNLTFLFNFSHVSYFTARYNILRKIFKNRFALLGFNKNYLRDVSLKLVNLRAANIFTYNGFRLKRQKIWKRKGKTLAS